MQDYLEIMDLRVRTILGVDDLERREKQEVLVGVKLFTDTRPAAASDDLAHSINYDDVARRILAFGEEARCVLIESFAEEIARLTLREFGASQVQVRVEKPGALRFARSVSVTIERGNADHAP